MGQVSCRWFQCRGLTARKLKLSEKPQPDADGEGELPPMSSRSVLDGSGELSKTRPWLTSRRATALATIAAAICFLAVGYPFFVAPPRPVSSGPGVTPPTLEQMTAERDVAYRNAMLLLAVTGAIIAVAMALMAASIDQPVWQAARNALYAAPLALSIGALAGWCGQRLYEEPWLYQFGSIRREALVNVACWALVGLGSLLAAALAVLRTLRACLTATVAGIAIGMFAGLLNVVLAAIAGVALAEQGGDGLVATPTVLRLIWLAVPAVMLVLVLQKAAGTEVEPARRPPTAALWLLCCITLLAGFAAWQLWPRTAKAANADTGQGWQAPEPARRVELADDQTEQDRAAHLHEIADDVPSVGLGQPFPQLVAAGWLNGSPADIGRVSKVTVVDIWDDLCIGCQDAAPSLVEVFEKFRNHGVDFVGLTNGDAASAERFVREYAIAWPNGYGAAPTLAALGSQVPTVYIIGGDGRIRWIEPRWRYGHQASLLAPRLAEAIESELRHAQ